MENNNKFSGVGFACVILIVVFFMFTMISANPGLINCENKYNKYYPDEPVSFFEFHSPDYQLKRTARLAQQAMRYNNQIVSEQNAFQAAERAKYPNMGWPHQERNENKIILDIPNLNPEQR